MQLRYDFDASWTGEAFSRRQRPTLFNVDVILPLNCAKQVYNNTKITVKDISLDSKTDDSETVLVTFLVDKEEVVEKIYFSYDQDDLIKDVYAINFK